MNRPTMPMIASRQLSAASFLNVIRGLFIGFCLLLTAASFSWSQDNNGNSAPTAPANDLQKAKTIDQSVLTFMGIVEPEKTFRLLLLPGERVLQCAASEGDEVDKGQLLAQLANDQLSSARFDLLQKRNMIDKEKQEMELTEIELRLKEEQLTRINEELKEEKQIAAQVQEYISTISKQLQNTKAETIGQIALLRNKLTMLQKRRPQLEDLAKMLAVQSEDLEAQSRKMAVKAPFTGEVVYAATIDSRIPPGGVVCELWSSDNRIRGRIMQHQIGHILLGDNVHISLDFSDRKPLKGKVTRIMQSRERSENSGGYPTFDVLVDVQQDLPWLMPGMMVSMKKVQAKENN